MKLIFYQCLPLFLMLLIASAGDAGAVRFPWQPEPPVTPAPASREQKPEVKQILTESKKDAANGAVSLGAEIQGITNALEFYRSEIEVRKKRREQLVEKQNHLAELQEKGMRTSSARERRELRDKIVKLQVEVDRDEKLLPEDEAFIRDKQQIVQDLEKALETLKQRQQVLYRTYLNRLLVVSGIFGAAYLLNRLNMGILRRMEMDDARRRAIVRFVRVILFTIAFLVVTIIGIENLSQVAAILGLLSAGLAIAMKDFFACCLGWFMLVFTRQVREGDFIEIGTVRGKVLEISMLKTTVQEYHDYRPTGKTIFFGNNFIFTYPLFNSSIGHRFVWDRIEICVSHDSDWRNARLILQRVVEHVAPDLLPAGEVCATPDVQISLQQRGVVLGINYMTDAESISAARDRILLAAMLGLAENDVRFA